MKIRGSELVARALEDAGVKFTFGIPGTHNVELYDALERSKTITAVLVTDEQSASFMADAVSRVSGSVGVANVVPGAGVTHTLSGVAEAFMDNIPMVVLACGIRGDSDRAYQLHAVDQMAILKPITKAVLRPESADQIYATVRRAFDLARSGAPGPVAVEIPAQYYLLVQEAPEPSYDGVPEKPKIDPTALAAAAALLNSAKKPLLYVGFGARAASPALRALAEKLGSPVATTVSGKGVFPESHPLWLWNGLGATTPSFVKKASDACDAWLAIGCRFGEVATGSYGFTPHANLIHVDAEPSVLNRNYPARVAVAADASEFIAALLPLLNLKSRDAAMEAEIAAGHKEVLEAWRKEGKADKVSPAALFETLQRVSPSAIYATDSGNGTFLAMERLRLDEPGRFIGPIDYSCMGYAVPAAIGAKFAQPERDVVAIAGDGALLMTGLELLTAAAYKTAPVVCVLRDGELGQIAQFQRAIFNSAPCGTISSYSVEAFAGAVGAAYARLGAKDNAEAVLRQAFETARAGRPVMVEVDIDYSAKTFFTKGVITTNLWRMPWPDRLRTIARAVSRRILP